MHVSIFPDCDVLGFKQKEELGESGVGNGLLN